MHISQNFWFGIALILLGVERLFAVQIPPWVAGVILFILGLFVIFG